MLILGSSRSHWWPLIFALKEQKTVRDYYALQAEFSVEFYVYMCIFLSVHQIRSPTFSKLKKNKIKSYREQSRKKLVI